MDLKSLLEYQSLDKELFNKEKEYRECAEIERFTSLQAKLKDLFQNICKLDKEAEEMFASYTKKRGIAEVSLESNGRIMQSYDGEGNSEKLDALEEELMRLEKTLQNSDRDLAQMQRRLVSIYESYDKFYGMAIDVNKRLKDASVAKDEKRAELLKSAEPIQIDLKRVRDLIPPEVLQEYSEIRKRKIMPVVVAYYIDGGSCGGCGMEVKHEVENAFNAHGLAECPNCGRMLYKK